MGMGMSSSGSGAHAHSLYSHIHIQAHGAVRVLTVLALLQTSFWLERCPLGRTAPGRAARCSSPAPGLFVPEDGVHTPCTLCHAPGAYECNPHHAQRRLRVCAARECWTIWKSDVDVDKDVDVDGSRRGALYLLWLLAT